MLRMFRRVPMALSAAALAVSTAYAFDPYLPNTASLFHGNTLTNTTYVSDDIGNTITMNGAVSFAPRDGKATWFVGSTSSAFSLPDGVFTPGTSFCMEAWIYPTSAPSSYNIIFDNRNVATSSLGIYLAYNASYGLLAASNAGIDISGGTLVPNQWQHVALERNGSTLTIYLNGVAVATTNAFNRTLSDNHFLVGRGINLTYGFAGIMDSLRVSSVPRYNGNFTPATFTLDNTDPNWNNVVFAMNFTNGLVDIKNNTVTNSGTQVMVTGKFRNECIFFPGLASKYASIASTPGTAFAAGDDFTIEMWMNLSAIPTSSYIVPLANQTSSGFSMTITPTGVTCGRSLVGVDNTFNVALQADTWFHLAFVRKGGFMYCFKDGVLQGTPQANTSAYAQGNVILGADGNLTSYPAKYFLSELRITKGVSRYNLVTAASEFTSDANTLSLLHFNLDAGLVDSANPSLTWTFGGTAGLSTTQKLFGQSAMVNPSGGCKASPTWTIGTGDYTLELSWYNTAATDSYIFDTSLNGSGNRAFLLNSGGGSTIQYTEAYGVSGAASITFNKPSLNAWHSFAAVRKNGTTTIYIDGVAVGSQASTVWLQYTGITIGGYGYNFNYPFQAYFDEFRFSNVARYAGNYATTVLIPTESFYNYNAADYYWDNTLVLMDCETLSNARNYGMTSNNVIATSADKKSGINSLYFSGNQSILTLSPNADFNLLNDFTIEFWMKQTGAGGHLINKGGGVNIAWAGYEVVSDSSGNIYFAASSNNAGYDIGGENATGKIGTIALNTWNHIAITRKGNVYTGFINGVKGYTQTLALTPYSDNTRGINIGAIYQNAQNIVGNIIGNYVGYLDNIRITKGVARYINNFDLPKNAFPTYVSGPSQDVYYKYNEVLLNFEGANNSNTFTNLVSGVSLNKTMNAVIKTDNFKTGASSGWFDGSSRVELDKVLNFGSSNFTMEAWVHPTSNVLNGSIITKRQTGVAGGFVLSVNSLVPKMYISSGTGTWDIASNIGTIAINLNTWNHLAIVRNGNTISLYVNGVLSGSVTSSAALVTSSITPCVGSAIDNTEAFIGYIDGVRISKGISRYLSGFIPPAYAFPLTV